MRWWSFGPVEESDLFFSRWESLERYCLKSYGGGSKKILDLLLER